ncbi:MAG: ABC transporter permease [Ruminococcaceae bacterium]|nr:ABC transporter permease [Oscillospiraceae bacterium]
MKFLSRFYIAIIFLLLYAPILVVILFSFNESGSLSSFTGFSTYWYSDLFRNDEALTALKNSLILAISSSLLATVLGTFAAFSISRAKNKYYKKIMESVSNIPMMNPDIVTGVSMMLLFVGVAQLLSAGSYLGFWTMLIAHTTFNLPYVILSVLPKFRQMDKSLTEAALDLGCTPVQTFFRVELPYISPGIVSGLMMSFTLSLDDFVISHFVSSPDFKTLPLYIYTQTAHEVKFSMYALCTLLIFAILVLLIAVNVAGSMGEHRARKKAGNQMRGGN